MQVAMLGCVGLVLGAIVGGAVGAGFGLLWTNLLQTSSFEGYSGMLVFFTFMPIGTILGGLLGAIGLGLVTARDRAASHRDAGSSATD